MGCCSVITPDALTRPGPSASLLRFTEDLELYVHDSGTGHPVLLLHGVGCWSDDWVGAVGHFRERFRVIRPDARGHGRSSSPGGTWTLGDFVDDLVRILDRLGIDKAHVAGFSMGGLLAQGLALKHPHRIDKLAIVAATTGRKKDEQAQIEKRLEFIRSNPPARYFDSHALRRWFTEEFSRENPDVIEYMRRVVSANGSAGYVKAYEVLVRNDLGAHLHDISHETLVLTGQNDIGAGPRAAGFIAEQIPRSHLIVLPRLRHQLLLEAPELVGGILREFFTGAG